MLLDPDKGDCVLSIQTCTPSSLSPAYGKLSKGRAHSSPPATHVCHVGASASHGSTC